MKYRVTWKEKGSIYEHFRDFVYYSEARGFLNVLWEDQKVNEVYMFEYVGGFTR